MTVLAIRPATADDADEIARMHVDTWRDAYAGLIPDEVLAGLDVQARAGRMRELLAEVANPFTTLVAVDNGQVAGFVTYGPYRLDRGPDLLDQATGEVLALYVHPRRQGTGIGRALLEAAVAAVAARGVGEVRLWVLAGNVRARRFYAAAGFAADGQRGTFSVQPPEGQPVDLVEIRYAMRLGGHSGRPGP